jgi:hypothetical protein
MSHFSAQVRQQIEGMRRAHPHWGPASLLLQLHKVPEMAGQALPSRATIGRFLHDFPEFRYVGKKRLA